MVGLFVNLTGEKYMTVTIRMDTYKTVHKALRFLLFRISTNIAKYDVKYDTSFAYIKSDFDELAAWLKDHGAHEDTYFHGFLRKKHPATLAALDYQHEQSEIDWRDVEDEAQRIFEGDQKPDAIQWHRFYLKFNHFLTSYLTHLQYEELVALPLLWESATDEELMNGIQNMIKSFTPKAVDRSKKWLLLSCNLSELKQMRYVP